jgi:hypothetical protein
VNDASGCNKLLAASSSSRFFSVHGVGGYVDLRRRGSQPRRHACREGHVARKFLSGILQLLSCYVETGEQVQLSLYPSCIFFDGKIIGAKALDFFVQQQTHFTTQN